jgi:Cu+-exporting ATPase
MARDPVCGMQVDEAKAEATARHEGKDYFFCSERCRDAFIRNPSAYISSADARPNPPGEQLVTK